MDQLEAPIKGGDPFTLWRVVARVCKIINALNNLEINVSGQQNKLLLTDAKATLELKLDGVGGAGGLGPCVFAGTAGGEPAYFVVNASPTSYGSPPTQYPLANPP